MSGKCYTCGRLGHLLDQNNKDMWLIYSFNLQHSHNPSDTIITLGFWLSLNKLFKCIGKGTINGTREMSPVLIWRTDSLKYVTRWTRNTATVVAQCSWLSSSSILLVICRIDFCNIMRQRLLIFWMYMTLAWTTRTCIFQWPHIALDLTVLITGLW